MLEFVELVLFLFGCLMLIRVKSSITLSDTKLHSCWYWLSWIPINKIIRGRSYYQWYSSKSASSSNKTPPLLSKGIVHFDWRKKIEIWSSYTTLKDEKKGAAVLLPLEGAAEEAVLRLTTDDS